MYLCVYYAQFGSGNGESGGTVCEGDDSTKVPSENKKRQERDVIVNIEQLPVCQQVKVFG